MTDSLPISPVKWLCSEFENLSTAELYDILRLRAEVFVVEQECPYQDLDNKDQLAFHLLGRNESSLCCYARLLPPGVNYPE
ncbi:MAG: drug:proton antiporter, partial [Proteobacteria bacterium]|nr:drug:proton antiporter [Pseudomonadota bacterium]